MRGATRAMGAMNKQMNLPALTRIMRDFERQNERMEMTSEMMGDAVDDAFEVLPRKPCMCLCTPCQHCMQDRLLPCACSDRAGCISDGFLMLPLRPALVRMRAHAGDGMHSKDKDFAGIAGGGVPATGQCCEHQLLLSCQKRALAQCPS